MLEAAFRFKDVAHVFFVQATDKESLEHSLLEIAGSIGHDLLSIRYPKADLATIWRSYGPEERIRAFKAWLSHPVNQPNLFVVDDLGGSEDEALIKDALPRGARLILYSTRNPSLLGCLERESQQYLVSDMDIGEIVPLMLTILRRSGVSDADISGSELEAVANVVGGHPLAACRAVMYILNVLSQNANKSPASVFVTLFSGADWEARLQFLRYKPRIGLSLMDTFTISLERMRGHRKETEKFLEFLAFVSGSDRSLDFRMFLGVRRPWLEEMMSCLKDYELLAKGLTGRSQYLAELESVSIGVRPHPSKPLQIHPLWRECIQQRVGMRGRVRWLRQIFVISHGSWAREEEESVAILRPFIYNALSIARRFGIPCDDLVDSPDLKGWLDCFNEDRDGPLVNMACERSSPSPSQKSNVPNISGQQELGTLERSSEARQKALESMIYLKGSCQQILDALKSSNLPDPTDGSPFLLQLVTQLNSLKSLEENYEGQLKGEYGTPAADLHCVVYDILIEIAPFFRVRNPLLDIRLRDRKEKWATDRQEIFKRRKPRRLSSVGSADGVSFGIF